MSAMMHNNERKVTRVVFFGTSEFAVPSLEKLFNRDYHVVAVVTNPDRPSGRKQISTPPPVKVAAYLHGVSILQPEILSAPEFLTALCSAAADLFITVAYGNMIPKEVLGIPPMGALNVHPSLLPRWRGPSPIQYAILRGDAETGVTIMKMDEMMDHGPIVAEQRLEISLVTRYPAERDKITYSQLHDALAELGADLLIATLPRYLSGEIVPVSQEHAKATYSKKIAKKDGHVDWSRPAEEVERVVRAFTPWPGAWSIWPSADHIRRIRIDAALLAEDSYPGRSASGFVWRNAKYPFLITSGEGSIAVSQCTLEGKKTTDAAVFVRGYPDIIGATLQ